MATNDSQSVEMVSGQRRQIDDAVFGIKELRAEYRYERIIFLAGSLMSLAFSFAIAVMTLVNGQATPATMLPLLGSGGTFLTTAFGSMFYFGKSHDLLRELLLARRNA